MNRRGLFMLYAGALLVVLSCCAPIGHAGAADATTVELYGVTSGFAKARTDRVSITVGLLFGSTVDESVIVLDPLLDSWNRAAGWQLFIFDGGSEVTDVTFVDMANEPTCQTFIACTGWQQFPTGWYRQCRIAAQPWAPANTLAHELGHCLGFRDVELSTGYDGIMSYARDRTLLPDQQPADIASLAAVGYRS